MNRHENSRILLEYESYNHIYTYIWVLPCVSSSNCNLDLAKKFNNRFSNSHFRSYCYFPDIIIKSLSTHNDFGVHASLTCCIVLNMPLRFMECQKFACTAMNTLVHLFNTCQHQEHLSGPPRGVFSTGSPHKASAPDPVRSGCPSTDFFSLLVIFL